MTIFQRNLLKVVFSDRCTGKFQAKILKRCSLGALLVVQFATTSQIRALKQRHGLILDPYEFHQNVRGRFATFLIRCQQWFQQQVQCYGYAMRNVFLVSVTRSVTMLRNYHVMPTHRHTHTQRRHTPHSHTDRQTDRETASQAGRQTDRYTHKQSKLTPTYTLTPMYRHNQSHSQMLTKNTHTLGKTHTQGHKQRGSDRQLT